VALCGFVLGSFVVRSLFANPPVSLHLLRARPPADVLNHVSRRLSGINRQHAMILPEAADAGGYLAAGRAHRLRQVARMRDAVQHRTRLPRCAVVVAQGETRCDTRVAMERQRDRRHGRWCFSRRSHAGNPPPRPSVSRLSNGCRCDVCHVPLFSGLHNLHQYT
jgi:hypothetical protein